MYNITYLRTLAHVLYYYLAHIRGVYWPCECTL